VIMADPAAASGYRDQSPRMGFFTDTSVCIGCKACEVACKTWNAVPDDGLLLTGMSYDNTAGLGADTWRHVAFIEQRKPVGGQDAAAEDLVAAAERANAVDGWGLQTYQDGEGVRWRPVRTVDGTRGWIAASLLAPRDGAGSID